MINLEKIDIRSLIVRTKRKTLALQVKDDATLVIRAPLNMSEKAILSFIEKHKSWIVKKKQVIKSKIISPKKYIDGEEFFYLGKSYKLFIVVDQKEDLKLDKYFILSKSVLYKAKDVFIRWYKKTAFKYISERVLLYSQKIDVKYNKVKISNAKKRWGSCSIKGNLNFSWFLIMAPFDIVDYVIVHELVHLIEKNHKKTFWNKVKQFMPSYREYEKWLKNNGYKLKI